MITRVTQRMLSGRELSSVELAATRMASAQEQMTTGRRINRPSDDPSGTNVALRARSGITEQSQYQRNANDGIGWLSATDSALQSANSLVKRAYTLALQGANTASNGQTAEDALAAEIDQIKQSLVSVANTQYLGRPVFGGTTAGQSAFASVQATNADGTPKVDGDGNPVYTIQYAGDDGSVSRRVGDGATVRVDTSGTSVFGADGSNVFDQLDQLAAALRSSDSTGIQHGISAMQDAMTAISGASADEGARTNRINSALSVSQDATLALQKVKSNAEDVDIAEATINMQTQTTAYQAALMAVSKTSQQSLLDFLS
jgi:flagellar hook-associated protein 3 FlgL